MKLRSAILSALLAAALPSAFAEDIHTSVALVASSTGGYSAGFSATHTIAGWFTDTFTFNPPIARSLIDAYLVTGSLDDARMMDIVDVRPYGDVMYGDVRSLRMSSGALSPTMLAGTLRLTVSGISGNNASYAGVLNVYPVPEPEMYAMMLGGLALLGAIVRRRKHDESE